MASDGTVLKPGLEYDSFQNIVGARYVDTHPEPPLNDIKASIATEVDVTFETTLDNKVSFPVGVYYLNKSNSGEDRYNQFIDMIKKVQVHAHCVRTGQIHNNILIQSPCSSHCENCILKSAVCNACHIL